VWSAGPDAGWMLGGSRRWIKKWKETVACGLTLNRMLTGVACRECSGRKQKCFLPVLAKEWPAVKPVFV